MVSNIETDKYVDSSKHIKLKILEFAVHVGTQSLMLLDFYITKANGFFSPDIKGISSFILNESTLETNEIV